MDVMEDSRQAIYNVDVRDRFRFYKHIWRRVWLTVLAYSSAVSKANRISEPCNASDIRPTETATRNDIRFDFADFGPSQMYIMTSYLGSKFFCDVAKVRKHKKVYNSHLHMA